MLPVLCPHSHWRIRNQKSAPSAVFPIVTDEPGGFPAQLPGICPDPPVESSDALF